MSVARDAQTVVAFLGLPGPDESEGYDRPRLGLPDNQVATLRAIAEVNPRVVVVLANGSAVSVTDWRDLAPAILETWLGGQAGGSAVADLLLGVRTPSGRLTETIPHRIEDTPAFGNFPGEAGVVRYGEGVLVGYRWYDTRAMDVAYPFGHGLSYTTFAYDGITASLDGTDVSVQVTVTNTGSVAGAEVVQVYVRDPEASVLRPTRELKAFAKVTLEPGESREVSFALGARDLSYWHPGLHRWVVEGGEFVIEVGASSRDIRGSVSLDVEGEPLWGELTVMSTIEEWFTHPVGGPLLQAALVPPADMGPLDETMQAMIMQMPAKVIADFGLVGFDREALDTAGGQGRRRLTRPARESGSPRRARQFRLPRSSRTADLVVVATCVRTASRAAKWARRAAAMSGRVSGVSAASSHWICMPSMTATVRRAAVSGSMPGRRRPSSRKRSNSVTRHRDDPAVPVLEVRVRGVVGGRGLGGERRVELDDARPGGVAVDEPREGVEVVVPCGQVGLEGHLVDLVATLQDRREQHGLAGEVVQQAGVGDADAGGHLAQGGRVVPDLAEQLHGRVEDLLAGRPALGVAAGAGAGCGRDLGRHGDRIARGDQFQPDGKSPLPRIPTNW